MSKDLAVTLQSIKVYNDNDGFGKGAGEIYINWSVAAGEHTEDDKFGDYSLHGGQTKVIPNGHLGTFNDVEDHISLFFSVGESDWGKDDSLGNINEIYSAAENYGIGSHTVSSTDGDCALTFLISSV